MKTHGPNFQFAGIILSLYTSVQKDFYGKDINGLFDSSNFKRSVRSTSNLIEMCLLLF